MKSLSFVLHSSLFYIESGEIDHINGKQIINLISVAHFWAHQHCCRLDKTLRHGDYGPLLKYRYK